MKIGLKIGPWGVEEWRTGYCLENMREMVTNL